MTRFSALAPAALLAGLMLAACTTPAARATTPTANLTLDGRTWTLARLGGQAPGLVADQLPPTLVFDPANARVTGSTGCNSLNGNFRIQGETIAIEKVATTRRACMNGMETEQPYLAALNQARKWKIAGGELTLTDGVGQALAVFKP